MTVAAGTKPHPIFLAGRWVESPDVARDRQPGRPDDARRRDLQRDRGAVRGGGRGRRRGLRGHPRRCRPTSAAAILREISAGHQGPPRGARPAHRARGGQADPRRAGRGRPGDADLPARRRGGGADDRRAHPARPDAGVARTGSGSPAASRSARSPASARSTSRSTWPPTRSRRRSPSGNPIVLKPPSKDPLTMLTVAEIIEAAGVPAGSVSHPADDPRARRPDGRRRALQAADVHRLARRSAGG